MKIKIRDKLLLKYGEELKANTDISSAVSNTHSLLPDIERDVNLWLKEFGSSYTAKVTLTEEWYDTRDYGELSLPRGVYTSLIIKIGEGQGRNWWCVMYPPMCLDLATDAPSDDWASGYTGEELTLISGKYRVKFKLLELISEFIS